VQAIAQWKTLAKINEANLKGELCKYIRDNSRFVVIRHEDHLTHGIPDISVTGNKKTVWIEVKFGDPKFESRGIQELTMKRLALAGLAFYVVYYQQLNERRVYIVHPNDIGKDFSEWSDFVPGFDHSWVFEELLVVLT